MELIVCIIIIHKRDFSIHLTHNDKNAFKWAPRAGLHIQDMQYAHWRILPLKEPQRFNLWTGVGPTYGVHLSGPKTPYLHGSHLSCTHLNGMYTIGLAAHRAEWTYIIKLLSLGWRGYVDMMIGWGWSFCRDEGHGDLEIPLVPAHWVHHGPHDLVCTSLRIL